MPTQQLDDVSVSWFCPIPDIPALTFYSASKWSYVICLSNVICQDIIWNVNLFLQYIVSSDSQSLLYVIFFSC